MPIVFDLTNINKNYLKEYLMLHQPLLRSAPETQGISSAAIQNFVTAVEQNIQFLHSFMLLRHGAVIAEG